MQLIKPNSKLFCLIYGMSGTGKTHLAATYCEMYPEEPVLFIDVDQGSATLNEKGLQPFTKNLFVISFDSFKDLNQVYELCKTNTVESWCKAIPELTGKLTKPFKCVIWDTWTALQWTMSTELRTKNKLLGHGLNYRENIGIQHWGMMTDLNKLSVASFKDLPMDCLFLMQAEVKEDATTGQIIKGPAIHGKLVTEMPAMFTTVIYTYTNVKGTWCATTLPKLGWIAKVRGYEGVDKELPTLGDLIKC